MTTNRVTQFLTTFEESLPAFFKEAQRAYERDPQLFRELADPLLQWAESLLGPGFERTLLEGYAEFVVDVNRSQFRYEKERRYPYSRYEDVFAATYDNSDFMKLYHWGVYTTTFVWRHHLEIYRFFRESFVGRLGRQNPIGHLVDLGCGSGVWHLLLMRLLPGWTTTAVDISETSIDFAHRMAESHPRRPAVTYSVHDALTFRTKRPVDAAISCFLIEHLERPEGLFESLAACLKPGGYAFVTCALTAAETDHIFEMQQESEPVLMAEKAGFRLVAALSAAPEDTPQERLYLPRSMALLLQKRRGEFW